jgi:Neutral/alkaline non-lysosomal ceramidase, N-terminal
MEITIMKRHFACLLIVAAVSGLLIHYALAPDAFAQNIEAGGESDMTLKYLVGMGKADMTPDLDKFDVSLNGYGGRKRRLATGVLDPLWARALVISDRMGTTAALISVDLCYVNTALRDAVAEELSLMGISPHGVLLAATHTHSGHSGYDASFIAKILMGKYSQEIFDHTVGAIVESVRIAKASMRPAVMKYIMADVDGLNRSRLDPSFDHGQGGYDGQPAPPSEYPISKRLTVITFSESRGKRIGALVNFAAHPTILSPTNMRFSADYPSILYERLEKEMGPESTAIFFNGALGDAAPMPDWSNPKKEVRDMREYGNDLSDAAIRMMRDLKPSKSKGVVAFASVRKPIRRVVLRPLARLRLPEVLSKGFYTNPEVAFQVLRIGELLLMAAPGEATASVGKDFESLCPDGMRCVTVGPANGYMGYLVSKEEYDKSGYESDSCLFGPDASLWTKRSFGQAMEKMELTPAREF